MKIKKMRWLILPLALLLVFSACNKAPTGDGSSSDTATSDPTPSGDTPAESGEPIYAEGGKGNIEPLYDVPVEAVNNAIHADWVAITVTLPELYPFSQMRYIGSLSDNRSVYRLTDPDREDFALGVLDMTNPYEPVWVGLRHFIGGEEDFHYRFSVKNGAVLGQYALSTEIMNARLIPQSIVTIGQPNLMENWFPYDLNDDYTLAVHSEMSALHFSEAVIVIEEVKTGIEVDEEPLRLSADRSNAGRKQALADPLFADGGTKIIAPIISLESIGGFEVMDIEGNSLFDIAIGAPSDRMSYALYGDILMIARTVDIGEGRNTELHRVDVRTGESKVVMNYSLSDWRLLDHNAGYALLRDTQVNNYALLNLDTGELTQFISAINDEIGPYNKDALIPPRVDAAGRVIYAKADGLGILAPEKAK